MIGSVPALVTLKNCRVWWLAESTKEKENISHADYRSSYLASDRSEKVALGVPSFSCAYALSSPVENPMELLLVPADFSHPSHTNWVHIHVQVCVQLALKSLYSLVQPAACNQNAARTVTRFFSSSFLNQPLRLDQYAYCCISLGECVESSRRNARDSQSIEQKRLNPSDDYRRRCRLLGLFV